MGRIRKSKIDYIRKLWRRVSQLTMETQREKSLSAVCYRVAKAPDLLYLTDEGADRVIKYMNDRQRKRMEKYKKAEKILLRSMSRQEIDAIQKENPFHEKRNMLIRRLRGLGISRVLLARVSGLKGTTIHYILSEKKGKAKKPSRCPCPPAPRG